VYPIKKSSRVTQGHVDVKAKWHTACTKIKLARLSAEGMIHTFLFHKWLKQYLKDSKE
jgi:hypothetical protein